MNKPIERMMNHRLKTITCGLLAATCLVMSTPGGMADDLTAKFSAPANAYKPHTWWHCMNGHVTKEAITRDLEDMKRIGLGCFTLWNAQEGTHPVSVLQKAGRFFRKRSVFHTYPNKQQP